jgi:hypothetical protein
MVTIVEVKQDLEVLSAVFDELTETVPASELPVFRKFVSHVTATMAAIQLRWSESKDDDEQILEVSEGGVASTHTTDIAAVKRQIAQMDRAVEQLWLDAGSRRENANATEEETAETARYFPLRGSPRRRVSEGQLREAQQQWDEMFARGRSHRDEAIAQLGRVLTPQEVANWLGVSTVTVKNWRDKGKLLAVKFDDHQFLYPAFQFADSPEQGESGVLQSFGDVLRSLPFESAWAKAQFFLAPLPALGGRTPLDVLHEAAIPISINSPEWRSRLEAIERLIRVARYAGEMGS